MKKTKPADWIFFADSDREAAKETCARGLYHVACFHAQQAAEKLLKACLSRREEAIRKTHSLQELYNDVLNDFPALQEHYDNLIALDQYYIPTCYPDALPGSLPEGLPTKEHAEKAIIDVEKLHDFVLQFSADGTA